MSGIKRSCRWMTSPEPLIRSYGGEQYYGRYAPPMGADSHARFSERPVVKLHWIWITPGRKVKLHVAAETFARMKERVRMLTRRIVGRSMTIVCKDLGKYLAGWKAYFRIAETPKVLANIDKWVRNRLRALQLKHWKRGRTSRAPCS
jgi:hypothetical protein